jgi:hypothetical protein
MRVLLNHQWEVAAQHAEHGVFDVEHVTNSLRGLMLRAMSEQYKKVGATFFPLVQSAFVEMRDGKKSEEEAPEQKGMYEEFWNVFHSWVLRYTAVRVKEISEATARAIRKTIRSIADEGGSYKMIAAGIREKAKEINISRATRIARTEVHVASTFAVDEAVKSTRVKFEREWVSVLDERTREDHKKANGQRRGQDEPFDVGGEHLMYPGDPKGSAGNIINCRCVVLYHAAKPRIQWQ